MPEVSQPSVDSTVVTNPAGTGEANAGVSTNVTVSTEDASVDPLRQSLEGRKDEFATKADMAVMKRQLGHVSDVQKQVASIQEQLKKPQSDERYDALAQRLDTLIEGVSTMLDPTVAAKLTKADAGILAEVEALLDKRLPKPEQAPESKDGETTEVDPEVLRSAYLYDAMWSTAGEQVMAHAKAQGVDISDWTKDKWESAQKSTMSKDAPFGDPYTGAKALMNEIDGRVAQTKRLAGKADSAKGGIPSDRGGLTGGGLTREAMLDMSAEELMKIPRDERDAVLRSNSPVASA